MKTLERQDPRADGTLAGRLRVVIGRLRRRLQEESALDGLSAPEASALARLERVGPVSASVLAGQERVRPQSMARTLTLLESKGYIRREPDPDDARSRLIHLTDAGRSAGEGAREVRGEWLRSTLNEHLTPHELEVLEEAVTILEHVVEQ